MPVLGTIMFVTACARFIGNQSETVHSVLVKEAPFRAAIPKLRVAIQRPTAQQGSGKFATQLAMHLSGL